MNEQGMFGSLNDILEKIQQSIERISQHQEAQAGRDKQTKIQADIGLPAEVSEYYRSEQTERLKKDFRDGFRLGLEIAGIILAVLIAAATIATFFIFRGQLIEMRNATKQASTDAQKARMQEEQQFRADQKPIVWLSNGQTGVTTSYQQVLNDGKEIVVILHYTNFGKSVAYQMQQSHDVKFGADALQQISQPKLSRNKVLLPTNKDDFFTYVSKPLTDPQIIEAFKTSGIVLWTRFRYQDSIGNTYETNLCMSRHSDGAWEYCAAEGRNDIRDCANPQTPCPNE